MKKGKLLLAIIAGAVFGIFVGCLFWSEDFQNYIDAKKLVEYIRNEDLSAIKQIIDKNPECVNTYPSITTKGWQSAMNTWVFFPLTEACRISNVDIVEFLLENGANPNCDDGLTPLGITYRWKGDNWYEISLILIENGASLDYLTDYSGEKSSVLQDIVQKRPNMPDESVEVLEAFHYALENCDYSNVDWMWVLQESVSYDRIEIVKLLLDQGYCNVNDTSFGMTPLMFASRDSTPEMVQLLLDYGADKNCESADGKTAYDYAVSRGDMELAEILKP